MLLYIIAKDQDFVYLHYSLHVFKLGGCFQMGQWLRPLCVMALS